MDQSGSTDALGTQITRAIRRLMSEQDRDPYSPTYGCFDRRYWGWKLADMPDASLQRSLQALAAALRDSSSGCRRDARLHESLAAGLRYAAAIQRRDGSFDQAFPYERSVSVTAFLLHAFVDVLLDVDETMLDRATQSCVEHAAHRAAGFLCSYPERHADIANHQAAAALALAMAGERFGMPRYTASAARCLDRVLSRQSPEGWFVEYNGADPGYQTLCLYYLALLRERYPSMVPADALGRSLDFVSCCIHPDGTFGGEYGSRRTSVFYPGGIALLQRAFPLAIAIMRVMTASIAAEQTTTLTDIDVGNLAPLLCNYQLAIRSGVVPAANGESARLPCETVGSRDLPGAGIFVRSTAGYFAILGASNGGVLKVFDKNTARAIWDDGGYVGKAGSRMLSTQATDRGRHVVIHGETIELEAPFYETSPPAPTPWTFAVLRVASLTIMRLAIIGEAVKRMLVRLLITGKHRHPAQVRRRVTFGTQAVSFEDEIVTSGEHFDWLSCGRKFVAIHMASAKYFEGARPVVDGALEVDVDELRAQGRIVVRHIVSPVAAG